MRSKLLALAAAGSCLLLSGCGDGDEAGRENGPQAATADAGDGKTIAASLDQKGRFYQALKAAGLDSTLAGGEPYTVFVPDDQAFGKLPPGAFEGWMKPESRGQLTQVLTYHILPGTVLAADLSKAIENGKGKGVLMTVGGETLTATSEGGKIVLTDSAGTKATVIESDQQRSNGVVHRIDAVLMPAGDTQA